MDNLRLPTLRDLSTTKKRQKTSPHRKTCYAGDPECSATAFACSRSDQVARLKMHATSKEASAPSYALHSHVDHSQRMPRLTAPRLMRQAARPLTTFG